MLDEPFRGSAAVADGAVTKNELRGPRYQRLFPDVYLPASDQPPGLITRSRAAYLLVEHRDGVLGGYSAAALLGAGCAPRGAPAEVIVAGSQRAHPGLRVVRAEVPPADRLLARGCRVTTPERTAWDLVRRLDVVEGVVVLDAIGRLRIPGTRPVALADLLARREREPGARGCRRLEQAVALADPRAESPMETRLRLLLVRAGLPAPEVQYELVDQYGFVVARFDLAYPEARLAIEYDVQDPSRREYSFDDRWRDGGTTEAGWQVMRFGYDDVMLNRPRTVQLVRNQLVSRTGVRHPGHPGRRPAIDVPRPRDLPQRAHEWGRATPE
ncbi:MAG TPA: hypothetical protein VL595_29805 [Pseudonocardia sp.]|jgi:very-short-patch-repair endonuclease|nr:hypothetical protein [Pseudonocardia sp.]